jgi:hypothetical protein
MTVKTVGPYTLKQREGHLAIRVYRNGKKISEVINCILTDESAKAIVIELGR